MSDEIFTKVSVLAQFRKLVFHAASVYFGTRWKINIAEIRFCRLVAVSNLKNIFRGKVRQAYISLISVPPIVWVS